MNLKALLQSAIPGWEGKLAVHHICYLGDGHVHRSVPYNATDPKIVAKKLALMQSIGVDTVICTWQGPWATSCHEDMLMTAAKCSELGMTFALLLDPGGMQKWTSGLTAAQITANVEAALSDPGTQAVLNGDSCVPEKYILDFNTGATLATLATAFPTLSFLAQSTGFSWPMIPWNQSSYASMNANSLMQIPGICSYFNDAGQPLPVGVQTEAAWISGGSQRNWANSVWGGGARILEHQGGQFLQLQLPTISKTAPYIAVVTWDDYDEQSSGPLEYAVALENGVNWSVL